MEAPWNVGDTSAAVCPRCDDVVTAHFVRRPLRFPLSRLRVRDVLVEVCTACDALLAVPRQSIAQIREAGASK
jgi:hypothetical protein